MKKIFFSLVLCVLFSSCASSDRMFRISPFSSGERRSLDAGRVNLWPVMRKNQDKLSVLWPVFDLDSQGFAIRPLFNKEKNEYSILFPLSAWNSVNGDGWVGNFYWNRERYLGLFPLCHFSDNFNYLGLSWWYDGERFGLFPVCYFSRNLKCVGPIWWKNKKNKRGFGVFPVYGRYGDSFHVGPYWQKRGWNSEFSNGIVPFVYYKRGKRFVAFPVYGHKFTDNYKRYVLGCGLFAGMKDWNDGDFARWINPLYYQFKSGGVDTKCVVPVWYSRIAAHSKTRVLLPAFYWHSSDKERCLFTPLGGCAWDSDGHVFSRNVLGPVFHWHKRDGESFVTVAWPMFESYKSAKMGVADLQGLFWLARKYSDREATSWHLAPFVAMNNHAQDHFSDWFFDFALLSLQNHKDESSLFVTPLMGYKRDNDMFSWLVSPVISYIRHNDRGRYYYNGFLQEIAFAKVQKGRGFKEYSVFCDLFGYDLFLLKNFGFHYKNSVVSNNDYFPVSDFFRFIDYYVINPQKQKRFSFLFYSSEFLDCSTWKKGIFNNDELRVLRSFSDGVRYGYKVSDSQRKRLYAMLLKRDFAPKDNSIEQLKLAFQKLAKTESVSNYGVKRHYPLLFDYKKVNGDFDFDMLFGGVRVNKAGNRHNIRVLRYLYRRERIGDRISRDFFPFVTWNSGKKDSRFSFLWHLINVEKHNGKRSGHLLFIPFGKRG